MDRWRPSAWDTEPEEPPHELPNADNVRPHGFWRDVSTSTKPFLPNWDEAEKDHDYPILWPSFSPQKEKRTIRSWLTKLLGRR
jgi:hypothetical protein